VTAGPAPGHAFTFTETAGRHTFRPTSVTHNPEPPVGEDDGAGAGEGDGDAPGAGDGAGDDPLPGSGEGRGVPGALGSAGDGEPFDATRRGLER
jgi:hypothetical protein